MNNTQSNNSGNCSLKRNDFILPKIAEAVLLEAEQCYEEENQFTDEMYKKLHAIYPEILLNAFNMLDRYKFIKYHLITDSRCVYKLISRSCQFTLYENINFCTCSYFSEAVLKSQSALMCEHVLALKLATIVKIVKNEIVSNSQLTELLNNQMTDYLELCIGFSSDEEDGNA